MCHALVLALCARHVTDSLSCRPTSLCLFSSWTGSGLRDLVCVCVYVCAWVLRNYFSAGALELVILRSCILYSVVLRVKQQGGWPISSLNGSRPVSAAGVAGWIVGEADELDRIQH